MAGRTRGIAPQLRGRGRTGVIAAATAAVATLMLVSTGGLAAAGTPSPAASSAVPDAASSPPVPTPSSTVLYPPETPPSIDVSVLTPTCDGGAPYLRYAVVPTGTSADTVTITWENPTGDDVVLTGLPLTGRVLWPGAKVDAAGKATDWPGWHLEGSTWVAGDEFGWARPSVDVKFAAGAEATKTVAYPESSPTCTTNPPETPDPTIKVDTVTPVCEQGVTYLDYGLTVTGTPNTTATLTWHNPTGGADFVQSGQPLRGRVLWPGAYPKRYVDLPASEGWELVNNMWQNTRDYGWAVGTVQLTFKVNPEVTVPVTFPEASSACGSASTVTHLLPRTGADAARLAAIAAGLIALGTTGVVLARRRRA
ncbi:LPXTG cell wall anchor domain-containing protein [Xylanimonas sp. McL0601]|uniref:LPXTG cell wall anchor domain-containing protein n=1 Tax=Xylanimonas sp. McL0601 TaxID=3414739 RepID=UPI003CECDAF7